MSTSTTGPYPLIAILLLATALRVWGLTWGLPSATHYFSYHPDESRVLPVAMFSMNLFAGKLLPHFYNYGSLQLYLVNFANSLAFVFGAVDIVPKDLPAWCPQLARMYLIGRGLTVAMGVGTVWATGALGNRLWGRRVGLTAALILAITPLHAQHSHWLTVDVPATLWVVLSLLWTARLATGDAGPLRAALLAGLFAGLAAATKYNMALVLLPLVVVCLLPSPAVSEEAADGSKRGQFLLIGIVSAVVAFLAACPGAVLESGQFLHDLRYEAVHVNNADDPTFKDTGSGFVYHITHNFDAGLGLPLLLLALASVVYAARRRERGDGLLAAFALPYYIVIGLAAVRYARYVIPLLPILALWCGRFVAALSRGGRLRTPAIGVSVLVLIVTLGWTLLLLLPMSRQDNRDRALALVDAAAPPPALVGFPVQPWFGTAPVSPYFPAPQPGAWRQLTMPIFAARIAYSGRDWDVSALEAVKPAVVVVSEYDDRDALRLDDATALAYLRALKTDYRLVTVVGDTVETEQREFLGQELPHDMLYTNPVISLYQRKQ